MTTVINNPGGGEDSSGVLGAVIGIVVLIVAVTLFFVYAWPAIQNSKTNSPTQDDPNTTEINVTLPLKANGTSTQ